MTGTGIQTDLAIDTTNMIDTTGTDTMTTIDMIHMTDHLTAMIEMRGTQREG